jgi:spoIIIJ-associated protein
MRFIEKTAKTIEEAVQQALGELKVTKEEVEIEVLEQPSKGIFGLIGSKNAKVRVTVIEKVEIVEEVKDCNIAKDKVAKKDNIAQDDIERAKKFLREVLDSMDIKAEIKVRFANDNLYINLSGPKMGIIIGRRGQTLDSLQYLVSLVVNKNKGKEGYLKVILDTEDYRRKREETLNRLANRLAEKVIKTGKRVELEPMNPYERRIIHSALQNYSDITTYSEGEEPYRKVIIAHK